MRFILEVKCAVDFMGNGQAVGVFSGYLARLFHPSVWGVTLPPAQNCAKTKNQLAHDSEARELPPQRVDYLRLLDAIGDSPLFIYLAGAGVTLKASIRIFQSSPSRITDQ
jgi:hypothetical protein